jgi:hypothetical protein
MEQAQTSTSTVWAEKLAALETDMLQLAQEQSDDCFELLLLLRSLNQLHNRIREEFFYPALPDNRQDLAKLLRHIEETGGWPFIERMRLQAFLANLEWQMSALDRDRDPG